ncbi:hypothetical protein DFJ58DRAFT_873927 [Suillus subalutaceus]|uniref:uncharacterized protein n=1 Tax=Suillus subalutaceus TaxID=48586 RepID=UPI001B861A42|nr:uncharacterized protein DFJ58DRAFT_873927 [Suillus subalutaceus]KAG1860645.1 hypothetical protein DFJ58DRAFT_873927 [Suillus subalutaceus]
MSESDEEVAYALRWNNNIAIMIFGLISYEYILHFDKEIKFVWTRKWSLMTCLYLAVRYFGIFLAMLCACSLGGGLMYIPERVRFRVDPDPVLQVYCLQHELHSLTTQSKQATFLPFYWNGAFQFIFGWRKSFSSGAYTLYTNRGPYYMC